MSRFSSRSLAPIAAVALAVVSGPGFGQAQTAQSWPGDRWPLAASPSAVAMDSAGLSQAETYSKQPGQNFGAGFVVRGGVLVHSWGDLTVRYDVKSVTKSIGSAALAMAIDDGLLALSDTAVTHMPSFGVPPDTNATQGIANMTIQQLATQTSGFDKPGGFCNVVAAPNTEWGYSDCGINWLADVLTTRFKKDLYSVMNERVFGPLHIDSAMLEWRTNRLRRPNRLLVDTGGVRASRRELASGISLTPDALARIGLLFARDGQWRSGQNPEQILPAGFAAQASTPVAGVSGLPVRDSARYPDASANYALMWWHNRDSQLPGVPTDAFWAWGLRDSLLFVIPSLDLVVVRTGQPWPSTKCDQRGQNWCPDYAVLTNFITPIVESVTGDVTNLAPEVDAGLDATVDLATATVLQLQGSANDDQTNVLDYEWTQVSGPATASIASAAAATTNVTFAAVGTYVFELSADDGEITAYDRVTVSVGDSTKPPVVTLTADPPIVAAGTTTTLTWSSVNATSCTASGPWATPGTVAASGTAASAELNANATFTLSCSNAAGSTSQTVSVTVEQPRAPTSVDLVASASSITSGSNVTLSWTAVEADTCTASGGWSGTKTLTNGQGSESVGPLTATTTFTLRCTGPDSVEDVAEDSVTVTVTAPAPTPPPSSGGGGGGGAIDWWLLAAMLGFGGHTVLQRVRRQRTLH